MKVGIIGSGPVGQALAKAFKSEGYDVMLGTRNPSKAEVVKFNTETGIDVGTFDEAAKFGGLLVLCTKGSVAVEALKLAGIENIHGKVEAARAIEPLCMLWCINGFLKNEWGHAFKLLKP